MQIFARLCLLFVSLHASMLFAQQSPEEDLFLRHDFSNKLILQKRQVTFGIGKSNNFILKYNPVSLAFSGLMYSYQKWISPQISSDCLYSCLLYTSPSPRDGL